MVSAKDLLEISINYEIELRKERIKREMAWVSEKLLHAARRGYQSIILYTEELPWTKKEGLCEEVIIELREYKSNLLLEGLREYGYKVLERTVVFSEYTAYYIEWSDADER